MEVVLDKFAYRHWDDINYHGARIQTMNKIDFINYVNEYIKNNGGFEKCSVEGYAPFCRHIFLPNPTDSKVDAIFITPEIEPLIKSGYLSRRIEELPVLCRWIEAKDISGEIPKAPYLDLIFYSYEQLVKESLSMNNELHPGKWEWALISIKGQYKNEETPMQPITSMRNALGVEYGGSSVPINKEQYIKSCEYWNKYI